MYSSKRNFEAITLTQQRCNLCQQVFYLFFFDTMPLFVHSRTATRGTPNPHILNIFCSKNILTNEVRAFGR